MLFAGNDDELADWAAFQTATASAWKRGWAKGTLKEWAHDLLQKVLFKVGSLQQHPSSHHHNSRHCETLLLHVHMSLMSSLTSDDPTSPQWRLNRYIRHDSVAQSTGMKGSMCPYRLCRLRIYRGGRLWRVVTCASGKQQMALT